MVLPLFGLLPWTLYSLEQDTIWVLVLCSTCHGPWLWHDRNAKSYEQVLVRVKLDWQGCKLLGFKKELNEFPLQNDSYLPLWRVFLCSLPKATELLFSGNMVLDWKIYQHFPVLSSSLFVAGFYMWMTQGWADESTVRGLGLLLGISGRSAMSQCWKHLL